ncbi:MAG TPA: PQQ-binding-like beta-propeller repeat protein [Tepidisphaeraceae bacterium]|jgi:outer membrane protein assembly factor BamB
MGRSTGSALVALVVSMSCATAPDQPRSGQREVLTSRDAKEIGHWAPTPTIGELAEMLRDDRVAARRRAADLLIDLAPETESIQPALCRALKDSDPAVARDAARALGALGERAAVSVGPLIEALSHGDAHVRLYAAEALASVGPRAAPAATAALAARLRDPVPGVRWAACEGLGGIGAAAVSAVPQLVEALADDTLYVRICAAGALGSIGPGAKGALGTLREAAKDPALRAEAEWAIDRIAGVVGVPAETRDAAGVAVGEVSGAAPELVAAGRPPLDWDVAAGRNIAWRLELGAETFGRPVFASGVVYVGTDNARRMDPRLVDECGVLMAVRAGDGAFLWQDAAPRVKRGLREFLLPSTTSAPYVEGDRLYYMTPECQLRCLDVGAARGGRAADVVWELDLCARLGVFPHEACNSDVLAVGGLLVVGTSNGQNEGHTRVPSPRAPSLIAVNKRTGEVVWQAIGAGGNVLHGQWCSPTAARVNGRTQVLFGGGDGWLRAYDAGSGRELWRFDGNPKDAVWRPRPGTFSRCSIVAPPVYDGDGQVIVAMGEDPSHGNGPSLLHAVSPNGEGDVTETGRLWTCRQIGRVVAAPVVKDGLVYVADVGGTVYCVDVKTGDVLWKHDTRGDIWGCLFLAGGRLYAGNVDGTMTVLRAGREKVVLAEIEMGEALYARAAVVGDGMYLATARHLYFIRGGTATTARD